MRSKCFTGGEAVFFVAADTNATSDLLSTSITDPLIYPPQKEQPFNLRLDSCPLGIGALEIYPTEKRCWGSLQTARSAVIQWISIV